jgi:hypothetical protein
MTIKISLLMMYRRIFLIRSIRIGVWVLGSIIVAWAISIITAEIFQCTPIRKAWEAIVSGKCINLRVFFFGNAIPNIATDVAILVYISLLYKTLCVKLACLL